ncbi:MAG: competence type IV pilus major pilin ComGC [Candidatus Rifleibacteriota bacterium]
MIDFKIKSKKTKGFTLIELMIVIAIMAILLGLAAYSFGEIRRKIRKTSCRENMRIIHEAVFLLQTEHPRLDNEDLKVDTLVEMGYLKKKPVCPSGGSYWIQDEDDKVKVSCNETPEGIDHGYID